MGGCRCSYKNCVRATKNSEKDFHFFHYPVRDPERCSKWISYARKPSFEELPDDQLRNKVVCQLHFEMQYFTNANRKRLVHNAVPTVDAGAEDNLSMRVEGLDVTVLQRDADSNVFTVGTENLMHTEMGEVTSYLIRNGNIIPNDDDDPKLLYDMCVSEEIVDTADLIGTSEFISTNPSEQLVQNLCFLREDYQTQEVNDQSLCEEKETSLYESATNLIYDPQNILGMIGGDVILDPDQLNHQPPSVVNEEIEVKPDTKNSSNVDRLSRTIRQHSREIASLKRIISSKKSRSKRRGSTSQLLNNLRGVIPSTLYGAVSLHLSPKKDNFTKDEQEFLVALYTASPAAYQTLLRDCKWKLPNSEVIHNLLLTSDFCS